MGNIKKITKKDIGTFAAIGADAFPGMAIHTAEEKNKFADNLVKRLGRKDRELWGYYDNKELLGGLFLYDFIMNLYGKKVLCGGGGFLAVDLLHKKEHVAKELCLFFFEHYRKRKAPLASLYPFRPDFYRKMGVGFGTKASIYRFSPANLPSQGNKSKLKELSADDVDDLSNCFNAYAAKTHGMFYEHPGYREGFLRQHAKSRIYGYYQNRKLTGYIIFQFKLVDPDNFIHNEIHIDEFVWLDKEAYLGILAFLQTQQDQIERIQYLTYDNQFHFTLKDPRNDSGNFYPSVFHEANCQAMGIMFRVLDTERIFKEMSKRKFGNGTLTVEFDIVDTFLPANNKAVMVRFDKGAVKVSGQNLKPDMSVKMNVADFSSLILGAVGIDDLYRYGLVEFSDISYLDKLSAILHTNLYPICLTHF